MKITLNPPLLNSPAIEKFAEDAGCDLKALNQELATIGRARRRGDTDAVAFANGAAKEVLTKISALNDSVANHIARDMVRRDLLPEDCRDIASLRLLVQGNAELEGYVRKLQDRFDKPIKDLGAREVIEQATNRFTSRVLGETRRAELAERMKETAVQKAAERPGLLIKGESAPTLEERVMAFRRLKKFAEKYAKAKELVPNLDEIIEQAEVALAEKKTVIEAGQHALTRRQRGPKPIERHLPTQKESIVPSLPPNADALKRSAQEAIQKSGGQPVEGVEDCLVTPVMDDLTRATIREGKKRVDHFSSPKLPEIVQALDASGNGVSLQKDLPARMEQALPRTADLSYKADGQYFHLLGRRKVEMASEMQRFDQAVEAFQQLVHRVTADGEDPVFKSVADLIHRVHSTHNSQIPEVEAALEAIREGLRGDGNRLTATAQKLLVWMAIASDATCLKFDDASRVKYQNNRFEVEEITANGRATWRPAGNGMLDVDYTARRIAGWFKGSPDLKFDKTALQNIGIQGPLYRVDGETVKFAQNLYLRMGKHRLHSLSTREYLSLPELNELRQTIHRKRASGLQHMRIDLRALPLAKTPTDAPLNLGNFTEIVCGSSHGNTALRLYELHAIGMIRVTTQEAWKSIYNAISSGDMGALDTLLPEHIVRGPNALHRTVIMTGGTLACDMGNDLVELQVRAFLHNHLKLNLIETHSMRNACFDAYWILNRKKKDGENFEMPRAALIPSEEAQNEVGKKQEMASLWQLNRLMNIGDPDMKKAVRARLREYVMPYYENLKLYHVCEDGQTMITHDRANRTIASELRSWVRNDGYAISSHAAPLEKAALVNRWFHEKVLTQDASSFHFVTQCESSTIRTHRLNNPLHALIGGYDKIAYMGNVELDRGIECNVSGRMTAAEAYKALREKVELPFMRKVFQPFDAYVETRELGVAPAFTPADPREGMNLFSLTSNRDDMTRMFDTIVASCLYDLSEYPAHLFYDFRPAAPAINKIDRDRLAMASASALGMSDLDLMKRLSADELRPERDLLVPLKNNIVSAFQEMLSALKAWDMTYSDKTPELQQMAAQAITALEQLVNSTRNAATLSRKGIVDALFSGPVDKLLRHFHNTFSVDARWLTDKHAETQISLDTGAGSQENHLQFHRAFFGI